MMEIKCERNVYNTFARHVKVLFLLKFCKLSILKCLSFFFNFSFQLQEISASIVVQFLKCLSSGIWYRTAFAMVDSL